MISCTISKNARNCDLSERCAYCGFEAAEAERRKKLPLVEKDGVRRKEVAKE